MCVVYNKLINQAVFLSLSFDLDIFRPEQNPSIFGSTKFANIKNVCRMLKMSPHTHITNEGITL